MNFQFYVSKFNIFNIKNTIKTLIALLYFVMVGTQANSNVNTNLITQHLEHAEQLSMNDPNLAIDFIEKLLEKKTLEFSELDSAKLKIHLIENYLLINKLKKSHVIFKEIDKVYLKFDVDTQLSYLLIKSTYYSYSGQVELAENLLIEAEKKSKLIDDSILLSELHQVKGEYYRNNYNDVKAIEAYLKAYELMKLNDNDLNVAYIESSMAKSYSSLYDFETAIELMQSSLNYFDEHNLHFDRSTSHYYLAQFYLKINQPNSTLKHTSMMISIHEKLANPSLNYYSYILSAKAYFDLSKLENARSSLDLTKSFTADIEGTVNITNYNITKAEIEIGEGKLADALKSLSVAQTTLELVYDEFTVDLKLELFRLFSILYAKRNDFEKAYQYQQQYLDTNELYNGRIRDAARSRQQVVFDIKKVKYQNQLLEKDKKINDFELTQAKQQEKLQQIIIGCILLILISLFIFAIHQFKLRQRFTSLANTDSLTKISSRLDIMNILKNSWKKNNQLSLISFDIDHFKHVNDTFGHPAGDLVLQKISQTAQQIIRSRDSIGRVGGEEFLVILNETSINKAQEVADRIRQDIENLVIVYNDLQIKVTASFGVISQPPQQVSYKEMLKLADTALYQAKNLGRNRVEIYDSAKLQ